MTSHRSIMTTHRKEIAYEVNLLRIEFSDILFYDKKQIVVTLSFFEYTALEWIRFLQNSS